MTIICILANLLLANPGVDEPNCGHGQRWLYVPEAGIHACTPTEARQEAN